MKKIINAVIGDGVTSVGHYAFYGCSLLKEVEFSQSVATIGNYAFSGCTSLKKLVPLCAVFENK